MVATVFKAFIGCVGLVISLYILHLFFWITYNSYWDSRVKGMCLDDGGVVVIERVFLSEAEAIEFGLNSGVIGFPSDGSEQARNASYVGRSDMQTLKQGIPRVIRRETNILRVADNQILGTMVNYSRIGSGAIIPLAEGSSFSCRDMSEIKFDIGAQIFQVE